MDTNFDNIAQNDVESKKACCTLLGPNDFFKKSMNIGKEALLEIFSFWKQSIEQFTERNFIKYDALVGENACHIRAFALLNIFHKKNHDHRFQKALQHIISVLARNIRSLSTTSIEKSDTQIPVKEFLENNSLLFDLPYNYLFEMKYIIDSFLLTTTKESLPTIGLTLKEKTSFQPVRDWGFAYNRAQYLVHNTQKALSALSCKYILTEALHLPDTGLKHMLHIKKDSHGRSFIPQFFTAKVLFFRALHKKNPLLFKVTRHHNLKPIDTLTIMFTTSEDGSDFTVCNHKLKSNTPVIMVEGVINYESTPESMEMYKERLLSFSILSVLLANFASHPQYSGDLKHLPPPFEEAYTLMEQENLCPQKILMEQRDFEYHKKYATNHGCSLENPNLLFVNHMYLDIAENHIVEHSEIKQANTSLYQVSEETNLHAR